MEGGRGLVQCHDIIRGLAHMRVRARVHHVSDIM